MNTIRTYANDLNLDERLKQRLNMIFNMIYDLQEQQQKAPDVTKQAVISQLQTIGLLGPLGQSLLGSTAPPDPQLQNLPTNNGTVTSVTITAGTNLTGGGTITTAGAVTLNLSANPSVTTVDASTAYKVAGTQVVGAQQAAIADATGAGDIVTQFNLWLAAARVHGLIHT